MNDSDYEGKCLSEQFGVGSPPEVREDAPPPVRTAETVTLEIRSLKQKAARILQQIALDYAIQIGQRLVELKAMVPHGQWGDYLKREVEYSQSTAQNLMRIYREYGASQQSLFGGVANSQALGNLPYTKALQLLALPDAEERERFVAEHDVESMSTRELDKALKARDEAEEEAASARQEAECRRLEAERLKEELSGQAQIYEAKLTSAGVEADQARAAAKRAQEALDRQRDKAQRLQDALSEANNSVQATEEEHARLLQELEELRSRPVDVAVEVDQEAVEAARKAAIAEMTEKVNKANDKAKKANEQRKNFEENLAAAQKELVAAQKELADLKAREPAVRELTPEELQTMTADAVEKARAEDAQQIQEMKKQLAASDGQTIEIMLLFQTWQENYNAIMDRLDQIEPRDQEKANRMRNSVKSVLEGWLQDEP